MEGEKCTASKNQECKTYRAHFIKMINMTSHEERCWSHHKIQHLPGQNRHKSVLPLKRMKVQHKAFSNECQQSPVRREENDSLLSQNTGHNLEKQTQNVQYLQRGIQNTLEMQIFHLFVRVNLKILIFSSYLTD